MTSMATLTTDQLTERVSRIFLALADLTDAEIDQLDAATGGKVVDAAYAHAKGVVDASHRRVTAVAVIRRLGHLAA